MIGVAVVIVALLCPLCMAAMLLMMRGMTRGHREVAESKKDGDDDS